MPWRVIAIITKPSNGGPTPAPVEQDFPNQTLALLLARSWARDGVQIPLNQGQPPVGSVTCYPPMRVDEVQVVEIP